ncbi:zinc finger E-box-binding homeobox protein zag-1-like isoform X2 [Physella acuta]|uniref:zinc finger E-box-binding homeobox protein zag-1-like isoform X2 n=1 Tax=Physella acuta TaxID=109671 RepID=UPI0027DADC17|nr:zinc finger E-box-binding homeobox protein zag-1-like isoform X2 [Physella acuta]
MEETKLKVAPPSNGPRPHRCEVCQRSFREIATLRKHEQLHRADRPYVCNTCGKSFLWSSNLKVHERVHTGERPYKCKICHRCFTQSNDLRRHERNVHMRGKIYGYKTAGRHSSQVNLAAYQAFAMQQRALLQQALTYESYLQKAAVGSGQAAQLFHHTQGMGGTGTAPMGGPRPPDPASSPRSPLKLEQVTPPSTPSEMEGGGHEKRAMSRGSPHNHEALHSPVRANSLSSMPLGVIQSPPAHLPSHYSQVVKSEGMELPHSRAGSLPSFSSFRPMQRPIDGLQSMPLGARHHPGHRPHSHLSDGHNLPHSNLRLTQEMIIFHHQHHNNNNSSTSNNNNTSNNGPITSRHTSPPISPQGMTEREKEIDQGRRSREVEDFRRLSREEETREFDRDREGDHEMESSRREENSSMDYNCENSMDHKRDSIQGQTSPVDYHHPVHKHRSREIESQSAAPSRSIEEDHHKSYPCDSVMDLSMNKSSNSPPSRASSTASSSVDKEVSVMVMPPPKTPTSVGAESESEPGKRDVTTTSATPTADSGGIHHCQHCNIFFYDYTMFHLHESLHMPYEDHPFRCPSCGTHCQDKIEFMFHTVWHVKYPHTIPNYTPFREGFLSSP